MEDSDPKLGEIAWGDTELERIVQELHDGPVQLMVGAKMLCESHLSAANGQQLASGDLQRIFDLLSRAIQETRCLMHRYGPPDLEESNWHEALRRWAALTLGDDEERVDLDLSPATAELAETLQRHAYRIVQEGVNNAVRHSQAAHIWVVAKVKTGRLQIVVRDDGLGFDLQDVAPDRRGVQGIRRRVQLLGGTLSIDSKSGSGTTITADLPLQPSR